MSTEEPSEAELIAQLSEAELAKLYRTIHQQVKALESEIEAKVKRRNARLELIKREMHKRMTEGGTDSVTVAGVGNFHFRTNTTVGVADWNQFRAHLEQRLQDGGTVEDIMGAFQKKVSQEYVDVWKAKHDGHIPPGVNLITSKVVFFRTA